MCAWISNVNRSARLLLLLLAALALFSSHTVDCGGDAGAGGSEVQWQTLTKLNYPSQIRVHPHLLLLVTVPWSGESRSLMKELAHMVASDEVRFGTLKLMVLYRNVERMLADSLGVADGITIFYYHNTLSYKYWGRLRGQNILSSVHYVMSLSPDELPLKSLTTPEELSDFLHSTDKVVVVTDFCGWTARLLAANRSMTESDLGKGYFATDFKKENNGTVAAEEKANRKVDGSFLLLNIMGMEDDKLSCGIDSGFSGISWLSQFTSVNHSLAEAENSTFSDGDSCTLYEFQQFEVFLQKLIIVAREFFLPPERVRFSVVQERSILSLLDIEEPGSGLMTVYFPGCPSCSKLEDDPQGVEATLPEKRPTMLLFVDRSSNSMQIRLESQKALNALRELAERTEMLNQNRGQSTIRNGKTSMEINRASWSNPKHPRIKPFAASQKVILNDKMSIMLMNEGQQVTLENLVPDLQGSSVHEILTYALKRQKELKLSSLAKDAGFQLLSKDFDIEVVESLPSHTKDQSKRVSGETPVCDGESADIDKKHIPAVSSSKLHVELPDQSDVSEDQSNPVSGETPVSDGLETADIDKKQIPAVSSSKLHEELPDPSDVKYILQDRKEDFLDKSSLSPVEHESGHHSTGMTTDSTESWNVRETRYSGLEENAEKGFTGSFYFLDGQYRLLETLTGGTKVPSVVIVDPISQKHYVLPEQSVFSYSSLYAFVSDYITGKLPPYQQSAAIVPSSRDSQRPPFVNLDFHETDSIPLVTTNTFAELVLGNKSDPKNSGRPWDRNVLVLFSNSWCGFCQRMELIVREVYRAVKSYGNIKINSTRKEKLMLTEYVGDAALNLPLIYMMDCTLNDCSLIVKPILQIGRWSKKLPNSCKQRKLEDDDRFLKCGNRGVWWAHSPNLQSCACTQWFFLWVEVCGFTVDYPLAQNDVSVCSCNEKCLCMLVHIAFSSSVDPDDQTPSPLDQATGSVPDCEVGSAGLMISGLAVPQLGERGCVTMRLPDYIRFCLHGREVYPLLLLFPAERKNNTVSYEGEIAVSDIIKFLAAHGSRVLDLLMDKSSLQDQKSVKQGPQSRSLHQEILLKDRLQNAGVKYQFNAQLAVSSHQRPQLFAGCVLSATDKLLDAHPFDESKILLVKVHQSTDFKAPLSFGGPVVMRGMPLVALTHKFIEGRSIEVLPNIYFIDQLGAHSLLKEIRVGNQSVYDYWFFLGYSSWGWEQLFHEIAQGAWNISKGNLEQLEWPWK
ncbi:UNVERIFIED_CONTAM: hypothetical protein Sradi_4875900 [Sesamum radiatum]|uniref:Thioredoxin domain-containing protein n=1 Tax=Sesamum radiatum TaxID=300843 RepID=A0AAW2N182_SESRA